MRSFSFCLAAFLVGTAVTTNAYVDKYKYKKIDCNKKYPPLDKPVNEVPEWTAQYDLTGIPEKSTGDGYGWDTLTGVVKDCKEEGSWAFTYDDGPSPHTPKVLKALEEAGGLKATFFVVGSRVCENANILVDVLNAGHEIASHTWSHTPLVEMTNGQIIAEIKWTEKIIEELTGLKLKFIRPPQGRIDSRVLAVLKAMGYTPINWTADTNDWLYNYTPDSEKEKAFNEITGNIAKYISEVNGYPGTISLQHDLGKIPAELAGPVIEQVRKAGWKKFVPMTKCMKVDSFVQGATVAAGEPHGKITPKMATPGSTPSPKQPTKETSGSAPKNNDDKKGNEKINDSNGNAPATARSTSQKNQEQPSNKENENVVAGSSNGSSMFVSFRETMTVAAGLLFFAVAV